MAHDVTKSWFAVLNNPVDHGYVGSPEVICEKLRDEWIGDSTTRSGAWAYCISADGLHHVHMVLEDTVAMRFSMVKKTYAVGAHLEPTKGTKKHAEDYIYKRHPYEEKGEEVLCVVREGTIVGAPGKRSDFELIEAMIAEGKTPQEIMDEKFSFRRYEKAIKDAYFRKRWKETPPVREVTVHFIVGASGSGKSYHYAELCNKLGEENICLVSEYANGCFDHYSGEHVLFLDEFKGELSYGVLLKLLDQYKTVVHARYANIHALWDEVYITSVYPPEKLFEIMVASDFRGVDSKEQLFRRINDITYCMKSVTGEFRRFTLPMNEYLGYIDLHRKAEQAFKPTQLTFMDI